MRDTRMRLKSLTPATWLLIALAATGIGFLIGLRLHQPPNTVDDAYITFRYARNLVEGNGLVYNPGEYVLGTTTPAYTLLLAAAAWLTGIRDFVTLSLWVNTLLDALSFVLVLLLGAQVTGRRWVGLLLALLFTLDARLIDFSTGGMESSFNLATILLTLNLFVHGRTRWAAALAGLAVLIRPDGGTLAVGMLGVLGLMRLREPKRWPWAELGIFLAVIVPWFAFATWYFGQPIPQSVLAKSVVYRLDPTLGLRAFLVQFRTVLPFSIPPLNDPEPMWRQALQAVLPFGLCVVGSWLAARRNPRIWAIGLYMLAFIAFFAAGNPLWLGWYEIPLTPLIQLLIATAIIGLADLGLSAAQGAASRAPAGRSAAAHVLALLAIVTLAVPQASRLNVVPWETPTQAAWLLNSQYNKQREADYRLIARMLAPAGQAGRLVATPEIGAFGYDYPGPVFDTTGLVSPGIMRYYPIPADVPFNIYTVSRQLVFDLQPDLFVSFDGFIEADLGVDNPEFLAQYEPTVGLLSRASFATQRLMVYRRKDLPIEVALPADMTPAPVVYADGLLRLEGYLTRSGRTAEYRYLELLLVWRNGDAVPTRDLVAQVDLVGADGEQLFQVINFPGEGQLRTPGWRPGQITLDRYELKLPAEDAGAYTVRVTLHDYGEPTTVAAAGDGAVTLDGDTLVLTGLAP